jgi:hypothetical protein
VATNSKVVEMSAWHFYCPNHQWWRLDEGRAIPLHWTGFAMLQ